ncbi:MAG TPA: thiamine pyrophosphate-binding protein [Gaiellaceae bacterium]
MIRHGGKLLADQLVVHGADVAFCVPGESYIPLLDGLYESSVRVITCRHEAGAANMADAYGKLTGRPGICMVTRGPGATHASVGIHTAYQDSTPLILLVGQVGTNALEREAFQELDYRQMFGGTAKWVAQIDRADRIPELVARAFATACSGRPGPVVLALPEDVLAAELDVPDAAPFRAVQPSPSSSDVEQVAALLETAERPFAILGGAGWTAPASEGMRAFLEANGIPAGAAFRRQDVLDNESPSYAGDVGIALNPKLAARVRDADVLLVVGPRLGEATTSGYTLLDVPTPRQKLVHVHPGAEELGRVYQPTLPILAGPEQFASAVAGLRLDRHWHDRAASAHREYDEWQRVDPMPGPLDLAQCIAHMRERVPDAIVTNGAGNHTLWIHRFWRFRSFPSQLAPTSGAMGYGLPAAIAAKLIAPHRPVVCFSGDGDFLMLGQELATAARYDLPIVVLVVDNGMYGTIRMHQERTFPDRVVATDLVNPDFAAYANAFGAHGEIVRRTEEFPAAFERALTSGSPAVLSLAVDQEAIAPHTTLTAVRVGARG